jgi:hypothetical protein
VSAYYYISSVLILLCMCPRTACLYAHVCSRMLTYADVCRRMLTHANVHLVILCMCPHASIYIGGRPTMYVSSYYCIHDTYYYVYVLIYTICVRMLLYMCSHIRIQSGLARDASPRAAVDALLAADTLYLHTEWPRARRFSSRCSRRFTCC